VLIGKICIFLQSSTVSEFSAGEVQSRLAGRDLSSSTLNIYVYFLWAFLYDKVLYQKKVKYMRIERNIFKKINSW
jgi:hypothetical protein